MYNNSLKLRKTLKYQNIYNCKCGNPLISNNIHFRINKYYLKCVQCNIKHTKKINTHCLCNFCKTTCNGTSQYRIFNSRICNKCCNKPEIRCWVCKSNCIIYKGMPLCLSCFNIVKSDNTNSTNKICALCDSDAVYRIRPLTYKFCNNHSQELKIIIINEIMPRYLLIKDVFSKDIVYEITRLCIVSLFS